MQNKLSALDHNLILMRWCTNELNITFCIILHISLLHWRQIIDPIVQHFAELTKIIQKKNFVMLWIHDSHRWVPVYTRFDVAFNYIYWIYCIYWTFTANSSRPRDAYMSVIQPPLAPLMVCRLIGAKPLSDPMLERYQLDLCEQWNLNQNWYIFDKPRKWHDVQQYNQTHETLNHIAC